MTGGERSTRYDRSVFRGLISQLFHELGKELQRAHWIVGKAIVAASVVCVLGGVLAFVLHGALGGWSALFVSVPALLLLALVWLRRFTRVLPRRGCPPRDKVDWL